MNQSSGGVESRHALDPRAAETGLSARVDAARAGVAPGPLDLFIRYRRIAVLALIVLLGLARWLGDGGMASW